MMNQTALTADGIDGGVVGIRNDKSELSTSVPTLWRFLRLGIIEIYRYSVVGRGIRVTEWK